MTVLAWHFCNADMRLGYGDGREIRDGETLSVDCEPVLCHRGLHGSRRLIDALKYAQSAMLCRVEIGGTMIDGSDKVVGTSRKCLWHFDATNVLHEFICRVAEQVLRDAGVTDERCWAAIETKRRWLTGAATAGELTAARAAAWAAACGDARIIAWTAAMTASISAARAAAWAAACGDARIIAWTAAWTVAGATDAALEDMNTLLESMAEEAHK